MAETEAGRLARVMAELDSRELSAICAETTARGDVAATVRMLEGRADS